ncbi:MAG: hypothetical protein AABY64_14755 [Bdellovibrionota bacterium]
MDSYLNQLKNLIVENVSNNGNVKNLVSEFNKLNKELKTKGSALNKFVHTEKEKKVKQAHTKYKTILKTISTTQKSVDKEVNKAIIHLKKSAVLVEKNLMTYQKQALQQKAKLEKILAKARSSSGTKKKKTTPKKRTSKS